MRIFRRYIRRLILFVGFFILLTVLLRVWTLHFFQWRKDADYLIADIKRTQIQSNVYVLSDTKENVIFLGGSQVLAGAVPSYFDEQTGGVTYSVNLAMPSLPISSSYYVLKDFIENGQIPDYVMIDIQSSKPQDHVDQKRFAAFASERAALQEVWAISRLTGQNQLWLHYFFPILHYTEAAKFEAAKRYIGGPWPMVEQIKKWIEVELDDPFWYRYRMKETVEINKGFVERMTKNRGYYSFPTWAKRDYLSPAPPEKDRPPLRKESMVVMSSGSIQADLFRYIEPFGGVERNIYTKKFFDLARHHNIAVFLIHGPRHHDGKTVKAMDPLWFDVIQEYANVKMVWFKDKAEYFDSWYFYKNGELNPAGARQYTHLIAQQFLMLTDRMKGKPKRIKNKRQPKSNWGHR